MRALLVNDSPPQERFDFHKLVAILKAGFELKVTWWVTEGADWSKIAPDLHTGLLTAKQVWDFSPDVVLIDGDPTQGKIPNGLTKHLQSSGTVFIYISALPFNWSSDRQKTADAFRQAGFPLATNKVATKTPEKVGYLATAPNDPVAVLKEVSFPGGIWGGYEAFTFKHLETSSPYILCPEEGGFLPLLVAPPWYDAKEPVWCKGMAFGLARKPYCFAGIRWKPNWAALFACDMFSDQNINRGENRKFLEAMLTEIVLQRLQRDGELEESGRIMFEIWMNKIKLID